MVAYWNFDGNANDQTGAYNAAAGGVTDITYVTGRNAASGQAASFNGTTSLIEIPNGDVLENSSDFSISFWMKCDTVGQHDQWVLGLSAWEGFQFEYSCNYGTNGTQAQYGWCKLAAQYSLSSVGSQSQDLWYDGTGTTKDFNNGWKGYVFSRILQPAEV